MRKLLFLVFFHLLLITLVAQNPLRFEKEVNNLVAGDSLVNNKNVIIFTGSSSIRFWADLKKDFPKHNVLNRGVRDQARHPDLLPAQRAHAQVSQHRRPPFEAPDRRVVVELDLHHVHGSRPNQREYATEGTVDA